jgi:hypothetical protein
MQRVCVGLPELPSVYPMTLRSCVNMMSVARADTRKRAKPVFKEVEPQPSIPPRSRGPIAYVLSSILLLVPCFWQSRLQAGDLSSHIYNAWLAQLIESGRAPGLSIIFQTTNVLFDVILSTLFKFFGAVAAQRISVSLAVLIFAWGAFAFTSKVSGRPGWTLLPCIAIMAYGWVFHAGFFNFYLSLGLCFWALAFAWEWTRRGLVAAAVLLAIAYPAHALPVVWTISGLAYVWMARKVAVERRLRLFGATMLAIAIAGALINFIMDSKWSPEQITMITGLDQVHVFDAKYWLIYAGMLLVWGLLFARLLRYTGTRNVFTGLPFQVCTLTAAGILVLPNLLTIPGYKHALAFIAERMSLALAVCICAMLGLAQARAYLTYSATAIALLFFGFLYSDERVLNSFEDAMTEAVSQLPSGQRVVSGVDDPYLRVNPLAHMIDRVCIGRCYSYANYEPSTGQFRIRATAANPIVLSTYEESWQLQNGIYTVQDRDLPLYQVILDRSGRLTVRSLRAGLPSGISYWNGL